MPSGYAVVGLDTAPLALDPRFSTDATAAQIEELVFESLTRLDDRQQRVPHLAVAWEMTDATTYLFHLRSGLFFSDGAPLTASDVKATYDSVLDPQGASPKRESMRAVAGIDLVDPLTLRFRLHHPFAPFLTITGLGILPKAQIATAPTRALSRPTGSGPFRLSSASRLETIALERNPHYSGPPVPLSGVVFRIIPDAITRLLELRRGTLDLVQSGIEPDSVPWLQQQERIQVATVRGSAFQYLGLNLRDARLADRRVRRALAHAIDREALVTTVLQRLAETAAGMLPPSHWAYFDKIPTYAYDPQRSRRLLDRAGLVDPDGDGPAPRMHLVYKTTTIDLRRRIAEVLQAQWAAIGVELEIRSYEWATFYSDVRRGNFDVYSLAWIGIEDPDLYHLTLGSGELPPQGMNRGFFSDAMMDRLTAAGRTTLDPERRARIYQRVQVRAARTLPVIPLWWPTIVAASGPRLVGFSPTANGSYAPLARCSLQD